MSDTKQDALKSLYEKIRKDAEAGGYHLNPDQSLVDILIEGLSANQERYGYPSCPCRLASGTPELDRDIVCPCDYRDQDLADYGACYCALYVSGEVLRGEKKAESIPERRGIKIQSPSQAGTLATGTMNLAYPVWRCKVCGYLCARPEAPEVCPICKVKKDRFERFL